MARKRWDWERRWIEGWSANCWPGSRARRKSGPASRRSFSQPDHRLAEGQQLPALRQGADKAQLPRGLLAFEAPHDFCRREPQYLRSWPRKWIKSAPAWSSTILC